MAYSGIAVNTLGHNHSDLVRAISKQAAKLIHISNYYHIEEQSVLADRLVSLSKLLQYFSVTQVVKRMKQRSN